ncbi:hypothetical protein FRC12_020174 [Ceratobasidium sp. 428]|nr:hypothetical protein FRC12_020174 [Ceratobasidium sp. 428]
MSGPLSSLNCACCPQAIDTAHRPELTDEEQHAWLAKCKHVICKSCAERATHEKKGIPCGSCKKRIKNAQLLRIHLYNTHPPASPALNHILHLGDLEQEKKNKLYLEGVGLFQRIELLQARRDAASAKLEAAFKPHMERY